MTDREAHDLLHGVLPEGATVTLSHVQWTRSTVKKDADGDAGVPVHTAEGDWHITVTIPGEVDRVEVAFAGALEEAVGRMMRALGVEAGEGKPGKLASPSVGVLGSEKKREVS